MSLAAQIDNLGWIPLIGIAALALWKGGPAERVGGPLNFVAALAVYIIHRMMAPEYWGVPNLVIDGMLAMGFLALALRYTSLWIGGAMLLQAIQFSLHAYYFVTHRKTDVFHAWVNNIDTNGILLFLLIGTLAYWRKRVVRRRKDETLAAKRAATGNLSSATN